VSGERRLIELQWHMERELEDQISISVMPFQPLRSQSAIFYKLGLCVD